jgi:hypothetical protein
VVNGEDAVTIRAIEILRERIEQVKSCPYQTASEAAPLIGEQLREAATTKRGNVPSFGKFGDVPIAVRAEGASVVVSGPDWVMRKARQLGQVDDWAQTILDTAASILARGGR